jgi:hypothetical protein
MLLGGHFDVAAGEKGVEKRQHAAIAPMQVRSEQSLS